MRRRLPVDFRLQIDGQPAFDHVDLQPAVDAAADALRSSGAGHNTVIAVPIDRSVEMFVDLLAVWTIGATYILIDPLYPAIHQQRILGLADPSLIRRPELLDEDAVAPFRDATPHSAPPDEPHVLNLSFTSGSTGAPKGARILRESVEALSTRETAVVLTQQDTILQIANPAFDAFTYEFWGAVYAGSLLVVCDCGTPFSADRLVAAVERVHPTTLFLTTRLFELVAANRSRALATVDRIIFGGEKCNARTVLAFAKHYSGRLVHAYGPTECTVFSTLYEVTGNEDPDAPLPIGTPLPWVRVSFGTEEDPAELIIGGVGVADGYVGDDMSLTSAFASKDGTRSYRTGDQVRRSPTGDLIFVGRRDNQIKRHGYRFDLATIESGFESIPIVAAARANALQRDGCTERVDVYVQLAGHQAQRLAAWRGSTTACTSRLDRSTPQPNSWAGTNCRIRVPSLPTRCESGSAQRSDVCVGCTRRTCSRSAWAPACFYVA